MKILSVAVCILLISIASESAFSQSPYPPSDVITSVTFAPDATIVRKALGSDNWPITWGDDNALYTSYGDGRGFEPQISKKLSLGYAKVQGSPEDFKGINIRSETGERTGDGKAGPKSSGMVMVDGVIYMWVRNTGNATIAWSKDHAQTWEWGFRFTESFGCPAFLNFGKNYEGARDEYVYTYTSDGPSAYESYDHVILARTPKNRITDRAAYEFFKGMDSEGRAIWTNELAQRGPVFTLPKRCQRIEVVYNPKLRRYLILLTFDHESGWGIFDAPEPWGPWTTAFYTDRWDIPGTHGYRLPAKWISPDGRKATLVFSGVAEHGYDAFCVREMEFK